MTFKMGCHPSLILRSPYFQWTSSLNWISITLDPKREGFVNRVQQEGISANQAFQWKNHFHKRTWRSTSSMYHSWQSTTEWAPSEFFLFSWWLPWCDHLGVASDVHLRLLHLQLNCLLLHQLLLPRLCPLLHLIKLLQLALILIQVEV